MKKKIIQKELKKIAIEIRVLSERMVNLVVELNKIIEEIE